MGLAEGSLHNHVDQGLGHRVIFIAELIIEEDLLSIQHSNQDSVGGAAELHFFEPDVFSDLSQRENALARHDVEPDSLLELDLHLVLIAYLLDQVAVDKFNARYRDCILEHAHLGADVQLVLVGDDCAG